MPSFIVFIGAVLLILWVLSRALAWGVKVACKRYLNVDVRVGSINLFMFGDIEIRLRNGLHLAIDKVWFSSYLINPEIRKPVVICIQDMRINGDGEGEVRPPDPLPQPQPQPQQQNPAREPPVSKVLDLLNRLLPWAQHLGLHVENITVHLLKNMLSDCLVHIKGQEVNLDIGAANEACQLAFSFDQFVCKVLRSTTEDGSSQNCLAELSVSMFTEIKASVSPATLKIFRVLVTKPQLMLTEGFLYALKECRPPIAPTPPPVPSPTPSQTETASSDQETASGDNNQLVPSFLLEMQEFGVDLTEMDVKIVRETRQRSLSVSLKLLHLGLLNQVSGAANTFSTGTLVLEEFQTLSPHTQFAGLHNLDVKAQLVKEVADMRVRVNHGFFHYHHDEVQYWVMVLSKISQPQPTSLSPAVSTTRLSPAPSRNRLQEVLEPALQGKKCSFSLEMTDLSSIVSTAACPGFHMGLNHIKVQGNIKPALKGQGEVSTGFVDSHDMNLDLEVSMVYCCHTEARVGTLQLSNTKHHWDYVLQLGICMLKARKLGKEVTLEGMKDNLQVEWSSSTLHALSHVVAAVKKLQVYFRGSNHSLPSTTSITSSQDVQKNSTAAVAAPTAAPAPTATAAPTAAVPHAQAPPPASLPPPQEGRRSLETEEEKLLPEETKSGEPFIVSFKYNIVNFNVFVCNDLKTCLMLKVENIALERQQHPYFLSFIFEGTKVSYIVQKHKHCSLSRSAEHSKSVAVLEDVRISSTGSHKDVKVHVIKEVAVNWSTCTHMCLHHGIQDLKALVRLFKGGEEDSDSLDVPPVQDSQEVIKYELRADMVVNAEINITIQLSREHRIVLHMSNMLMTTYPHPLVDFKLLTITCDEHTIFTLRDVMFEVLPPTELSVERHSADYVEQALNRAWGLSFSSFSVVFPHRYNFAACFEEVVNTMRWLKLVHNIRRKEFTAESKLPPDLRIRTKLLSIQLCDDPFEVKLGDNYELLKDEWEENLKRISLMDKKMAELQKTHGYIPARRREELYTSLAKKSAEIYIQRSKKLNTSHRNRLLMWEMENLEIVALADPCFHGKENVVRHMCQIDPDSPYPERDLDFSTLWCRYINFTTSKWTVMLRDYPQPMIAVTDMNLWGRLIGAEQEGTKRAKRSCVVEVEQPWGDVAIQRSLPPLKFFHDFSCDVGTFIIAYGFCWEPTVAQVNHALDLINKPSVDPSRPLPLWDKIRLLFHGRLTMSIDTMTWLYHASFNPYNTTEMMEWTWRHLILDWTNAKFVLKGDLNIYIRTASKYDDCKLLHLPNVRLSIRLEWLCLGDPNDHHSVMPCAPDKVPDYSMEEHDSFRAFRSQNLNLEVSFETQLNNDNPEDIPTCVFYASTLRFMERIKWCILSVTRPIKRGKIFGLTTPRKLQLTRHYKKIKLSTNFHQFSITYWPSFSKQHGWQLHSDSFVLHLGNKLALKPFEDGLTHRPRAEWSIRYLNCELGQTKIWLCQSEPEQEEGASNVSFRNLEKMSFFMSVYKISYNRTDKTKEKRMKNVTTEEATPTHKLQVVELKGVWNKKNHDIVIALYDGIKKAQSLRQNLSSEALRGFKVDNTQQERNRSGSGSSTQQVTPSTSSGATSSVSPSPLSKLQTSHAYSMLMKLVSESDSKSVAFTDETANNTMDQLHGMAACQTDDVQDKVWLIELYNSQVILKGCETPGYVIVSAAKAQILSCLHHPVWRHGQLRSKTTWVGSVECMQYYATVDPGGEFEFEDSNVPWLSKEHVEERNEADLSGVPEMVGSGLSVGGVITSTVGPSKPGSSGNKIQLQRIISRCRCQFFYANYGDMEHNANLADVPRPPTEEEVDMMHVEEGVDAFTLLHHDLNISTNTLQYTMIFDIVNNLLLHVAPKEAYEKLQSMRFRLQLSTKEDQKTPILQLQEKLRTQLQILRSTEREMYMSLREAEENAMSSEHEALQQELEQQLNACKDQINLLNEELSVRISCYKESQLEVKAQMKAEKAQQVQVMRRNEVCFKFAQWRLTETDGQLGIADLVLRNFLYTKVNRDDDTWTHQLEVGWVKMSNLLPNSIYKDVLVPMDSTYREKQVTLRIQCSERPPVGGISVKEHFEVNLVPVQIQLTKQFYMAVYKFLFPDKNAELDEEEEMEGQKKKGDKKAAKEKKEREVVKKSPSFTSADDIDKMKERAANNHSFLYTKIPELHIKASYKGENIPDIHDYNFVLPTVEFHNRIWTWFDFFLALKSMIIRRALPQVIKQKLRFRPGEETPLTDVQLEEDKAKMLLGAKLLAGQEKPPKKSFFGVKKSS